MSIHTVEYLDIFDEFNQSLYTSKSRADVHAQGDWHRTMHVWFHTADQILLQLRSK